MHSYALLNGCPAGSQNAKSITLFSFLLRGSVLMYHQEY